MPTEMQTVTTTVDYHVAASDQLRFTNQPAFQLSQGITASGASASSSPHLSISGEVDVVSTSTSFSGNGLRAIEVENTFDRAASVTLDTGATLNVSVSGGIAVGYFGGGSVPPIFDNAGAIFVSADGAAKGVFSNVNLGVLTNRGQITVTSTTSDAVGLANWGGYRGQILNSGAVTVTGHGQVTGVDMGPGGGGQVFHNTGTIIAHDDSPTTTSVGVYWANGPGLDGSSFVNDGTIEADRAVEVNIGYGTAAENLITNNGHMIGAVWLGGGASETLVNNGDITGDIRLIGAGSVYDGRLGTAEGTITASNNGDTTLLGGVGAETMSGGFWNDSIASGGGNDFITGGDGRNTLFGGDGDDSIVGGSSFDQVNGNKGDDTIVGHSTVGDWLLGGQGQDTIDASASAGNNIINGNLGNDTIVGGAGADSLRGGQGDDVIHVGSGNAWITGDLGTNTIYGGQGLDTFRANAGHDIVYGWHAGDHIELASGLTYTISQVSADVHINFSNGGEIDLIGVQQTSLQPGWIASL